MAAPSVTYSYTNGTVASATEVNQNFTDLINGVSDASKDLSINALTVAGTATFNGAVTLGNAAGDDITVTGSLASTIPIKTTATYNIGSSTLGLAGIYFGANSQTVRIIGSGSMSATWTLTLPITAGTANYLLQTNGSGVTSWVGTTPLLITGVSDGSSAATGLVGEFVQVTRAATSSLVNDQYLDNVPGGITLTAGCWDVQAYGFLKAAATTTVTEWLCGIGTVTGDDATGLNAESVSRYIWNGTAPGTGIQSVKSPLVRVNPSTLTTYYGKVRGEYAISTMSVTSASVRATRIR